MKFVSNKAGKPANSKQVHLKIRQDRLFCLATGNIVDDRWYTSIGVFDNDDADVEIFWLDETPVDGLSPKQLIDFLERNL
jgi:hypothetical protein